jgi:hypothetical protein
MLAELGFALPKQTVLFNAESKAFNERKIGVSFSNREVEVPPVKLDWQAGAVLPGTAKHGTADPHPIRTSLRVTSRSAGDPKNYDLRIRHPRPVYHLSYRLPPEAVAGMVASLAVRAVGPLQTAALALQQGVKVPDEASVFLMTREESWNEEHPFVTKKGVPRYEPAKDDDPKKGTVEEKRRGPFPIGAAVEEEIPASWYDKPTDPKTARIAVVGNGGVFVGPTLNPPQQKLLLDVVDWLLGRDDLLAQDRETWQYPRVELSATENALWQWGTRLGLPLLFAYLGMAVWMVRRMR